MDGANRNYRMLSAALENIAGDEQGIPMKDFADVADSFIEGYNKLVKMGNPGETVALAMLGATINIYEMFGMKTKLPLLFRSLAEQIEAEGHAH